MLYVFSCIDILHTHHVCFIVFSLYFIRFVCFIDFRYILLYFNVFLRQRGTSLRVWAESVPGWGSDSRLCDECAMRTWAQNHPPGVHSPIRSLSDKTCALSTSLGSHLLQTVCAKQSLSFLVGWPCLHPWMLTIEWSANPKAPTLLHTYGWLPGLVDRAQVLPETSYNLGWGFQEVILCSNSHCTLIAQSRVSPQWGIERGQIRRGICCCFKNTLRYDKTQWTSPQNTPIL